MKHFTVCILLTAAFVMMALALWQLRVNYAIATLGVL
jgi:hypothetical protein